MNSQQQEPRTPTRTNPHQQECPGAPLRGTSVNPSDTGEPNNCARVIDFDSIMNVGPHLSQDDKQVG